MCLIQGIITIIIAILAAGVFTGLEIPVLQRKQFGQYIREEGPKSHLKKQGTPTMGGLAIYGAITICSLISAGFHRDVIIIVIVGFIFGLIGFLDDYIKVAAKHNLGLRAWQKLVLQIAAGILLGIYIVKYTSLGSRVWIPIFNFDVDFGIFFVPFVCFVMVAMANSVNLSDGMDGLCAGASGIFSGFFAIVSYYEGGNSASIYLCAVFGACIGFLIFNKYPAKIFMGDTGSMALGGGMTAAIIMTKTELLIPVAGIVFVAEALSVIIQVAYFKKTGKRVFRMAPLHHHFEEGGMKETKVVRIFWLATLLACIISFCIFYLSI